MMINNTTSDDEEMMINMLFINILFDVDQEMMVNFSSGHIQLDWKRAEESRSKSTGKSTWLCNMSTCFCFPLHAAKPAGVGILGFRFRVKGRSKLTCMLQSEQAQILM